MSAAAELRAAAQRLRSGMLIVRADLDPLLAGWMELAAACVADEHPHGPGSCTPETCTGMAALALTVARAIGGEQ